MSLMISQVVFFKQILGISEVDANIFILYISGVNKYEEMPRSSWLDHLEKKKKKKFFSMT